MNTNIFIILGLIIPFLSGPPPPTEIGLPVQKVQIIKQLPDPEIPPAVQMEPIETPKVETVKPPLLVDTSNATGSSDAKSFIYSRESGNNPGAVNSLGCRGLGQACPGSKLPCGDDYACQDAYFTQYMLDRYGSWENAKSFWLSHNWW